MLDVAPNPFSDPINKIFADLKATKWKIPYILPLLHALISVTLLLVLVVLFATIGFISQVSNSFWKVVSSQGQKMSFSNPLPSFYYAISAAVFFIIFLPFFILQSPFWFSGWITSKIGFKLFIILLIFMISSLFLYYFEPELADTAVQKISEITEIVRKEIFPPDTLNIQIEQSSLMELNEPK